MERTDLLELMATLLVSDTVTKAQMSMSSSSSHETPRWRKADSNHRSRSEKSGPVRLGRLTLSRREQIVMVIALRRGRGGMGLA